jgi:putative heme iron utilization protein
MAATQEPVQQNFYAHAKLLLGNAKAATLATAEASAPFAALVTPAFMADFSPILLLSQLSTHTRQLQANPACALLVVGEAAEANPQTAPRLCLTGTAAPVDDPAVRAQFLATHPYAKLYADFADFGFWRIEISAVHYVGGFAAAARLDIFKLRAGP